MELKIFQVDAFAQGTFTGNPAAVVPLSSWLPDETLQAIAEENNLAETAFVIGQGDQWELRWFTPGAEVALCGHATLGAAHAIFEHLSKEADVLKFSTRQSGVLTVERTGDQLSMDFPALPPKQADELAEVSTALRSTPSSLWEAQYSETQRDLLAVFESEDDVANLAPDFGAIAKIPSRGVICTAPGSETDFVSRYFAPAVVVDEDPFTGSAHCIMTPYWVHRLGKKQLSACQISKRKGWATCKLKEDRVELVGRTVTFMTGNIYV